ncbi:MFS transporter [Nitrincola sp. MINF-07-Sa-05]|uniref:MFS transporter n=1 Tax=Nitrincola salilacus TaxID=3400273 RepID=UPI003917D89B
MIESDSPQFWRATAALCLASFMVFANLYVTQPLLPMLAGEFNITAVQASWSFTLATLTLSLSLLFYGPLSDAVGRRGIMLMTLCGVTASTLALSLVSSYEQLLLLRGIQGFFLAGVPAIAIAYMGDEFSRKGLLLAVGLYVSANSLGGIAGRLVGGFTAESLGLSGVFMMMALVSFVCLALVFRLLPASQHFRPQGLNIRRILGDISGHLRNPPLLLAYIIGGFNFFIFVNQYSYITFVLVEDPYRLSTAMLGMLFLTYLTGTFGSAISGRVAQRLSQPLCMALGIVILMCGTLLTLLPSLVAIIAGLFINSFGFFITHSCASSWVSHQAQHAKASASSLYLVFYYMGASTGGLYLAPFWQQAGWSGVVVGSLIIFSLTLACAAMLLLWQRRSALVS